MFFIIGKSDIDSSAVTNSKSSPPRLLEMFGCEGDWKKVSIMSMSILLSLVYLL